MTKLEQLVLSVLEQLVQNAEAVATSSNSPEDDDAPSSQAAARPKLKRVVILMAGRA